MSPAPTARARPSPSCAPCWRRPAAASMSTPRRIWCASTSAFASARPAAASSSADDDSGRRARRMRARQRRRADHGVRDRDRGGVSAVLAPSRRRAAARSRPRRPARRHQRDRARRSPASITPVSIDHAGISRRHASRRSPPRKPASSSAACRPSSRRSRAALAVIERQARAHARAAAQSPASIGTCTRSAAGWSIRTTTACSICRRRSSTAATSSTTPAPRSRRCARADLKLPLPAFEAGIAKADWPARHAAALARHAEGAGAARTASSGSTAATTPTAGARSRRRSAISRSACRGRWC